MACGRHADMAHHRDAALGEIADGLGHMHAAFELDRAAARFLHHARGVAEGDRRAFLVGAERHVDHDQRAGRAAHHRLRMHDHQLERHRHRGLVAVHHHAEGIADEQHVDMRIDDARGMGVIGGERHDRRAALAVADVGRRHPLKGKFLRHFASSSSTARPRPSLWSYGRNIRRFAVQKMGRNRRFLNAATAPSRSGADAARPGTAT